MAFGYESNILRSDQITDIVTLTLGSPLVSADDIYAFPKLKLIQQNGRGVDSVDRNAAPTARISVAMYPVALASQLLSTLWLLCFIWLSSLPRCNTPSMRNFLGRLLV